MFRQIKNLVLISSILVTQAASAVSETEEQPDRVEKDLAIMTEILPQDENFFFRLTKSEEIVSCSKFDLISNIGASGHFLSGAMSGAFQDSARTRETAIEVKLDPKLFKRIILPLLENGSVWVEKLANAKNAEQFLDYWLIPYQRTVEDGISHFTVSPGEKSLCPKGYLLVPGNPLYATPALGQDFCVMKYDASNQNGVAMSQEAAPWVYIGIDKAEEVCAAKGAGHHLMTNSEWQTIARNIESNPKNWSGGAVGKGYLSRGNSDARVALVPTEANLLTGINKRTHQLTTGEEIWDMAGNVKKWVSNGLKSFDLDYYLETVEEYTQITDPILRLQYAPEGSFSSVHGMGKIFFSKYGFNIRGGAYNGRSNAGVFAWDVNPGAFKEANIGFRCAYSIP